MPDSSVLQTAISTTGALLGALGAVVLTNRISARHEEVRVGREEARFDRQRQDQQAEECQQAHQDLLGTAAKLRVDIVFVGLRHWNDMNVRLATIQHHAVSAGLQASRIALLSRGTADVAFELASAASRLAATTAEYTVMAGNNNDQLLSGQVTRPIDLTEFDECTKRFSRAVAQDS